MEKQYNEKLKETYNKYANDREKKEAQDWKIDQIKEYLELIKKENKKTILEIGAGPGRDSKFFMDNGLEATATDLSEEMVKICKGKGIRAFELDFLSLHKLEKHFDAIWALNCLLHVDKKTLPLVFAEINDRLKPSGLFFMGVYGGDDSEGIWENDIYSPPRFFSSFSDEKLKEEVAKHFNIINFKRIETGGDKHFQALTLRKKA